MAVIDCSKEQYYATHGDVPWRFFWMHFSGCAADSFVRMVNGGGLRTADGDPSRAAELFDQLDSIHSVAEIAAMVGYSDARGLINSFKKREGCTPSCLRRRKAEERILP